jgi:hypothetical protein
MARITQRLIYFEKPETLPEENEGGPWSCNTGKT